MIIPRKLRKRAVRPAKPAEAEPTDRPTTFYAAGGTSSIERSDRQFEYGERRQDADMPIVIGFRPNEERS